MSSPAAQPVSGGAYEHLGYGWMKPNIDSSGVGFGVIARSVNWNPAIGTIARDLGSLVTRRRGLAESVEVAEHRGHRLLVRQTKAREAGTRQGANFVHMLDVDGRTLGEILALVCAGLPYSSRARYEIGLPSAAVPPLRVDDPRGSAERAAGAVPGELVAAVAAAILGHLDGRAARLGIVGLTLDQLAATLWLALDALPAALAERLGGFVFTEDDLDAFADDPRLVGAASTQRAGQDRLVIDARDAGGAAASVSPADLELAADALRWHARGAAVDDRIADVHAFRVWLDAEKLRAKPVRELSGGEVAALLAQPQAHRWLDEGTTLREITRRAMREATIAQALAETHSRSPIPGLSVEVPHALYESGAEDWARTLHTFGLPAERFEHYAAERLLGDLAAGHIPAHGARAAAYPALTASTTLLEPTSDTVRTTLMGDPEFRRCAAQGHPAVALWFMQWQLTTPAAERDAEAMTDAAHRHTDLVERAVAEVTDADPRATVRWALTHLPATTAAAVLADALDRGGAGVTELTEALAACDRPDAEVHRILVAAWPNIVSAYGVPARLARWTTVVDRPEDGPAYRGAEPPESPAGLPGWPAGPVDADSENGHAESHGFFGRVRRAWGGRRNDRMSPEGEMQA